MPLEADLHLHTLASGHAYSTVKEMVLAAKEKGLKMIALTDHGPRMPGGPHLYHFTNLAALPRVMEGIEVLRGVEANILDANGTLDLPDSVLQDLDIVLAGLHRGTGFDGASSEEYTKAAIEALKHPRVHLIVHPGNPEFPIDLERLVLAAAGLGKALEINNSSLSISRPGSLPRCRQLARLAKRYGVWIAINSDAHVYTSVGDFSKGLELAWEAGIGEGQILNLTVSRVKGYLKGHGVSLD